MWKCFRVCLQSYQRRNNYDACKKMLRVYGVGEEPYMYAEQVKERGGQLYELDEITQV